MHRDLKPGNIKITPAGNVKVLDFGLAKALGEAPDSRPDFDGNNASTERTGVRRGPPGPNENFAPRPVVRDFSTEMPDKTEAGMMVGTAAYMSPEQAEAKFTDRRSDVWSFGVVLYEMLSGKRCFAGETTSHVLAHILEQEPDWQALPATAPVGLRLLLERCLTKDPAERLRDISDVRVHLRALEKEAKSASKRRRVGVVEAAPSSVPSKQTRRARRIWPAAGGACAIAALLGFLYFHPKPAPAGPPVRFEVPAPANARLSASLAISPDGHNLAFLASDADNVSRLWVRSFENLESRPLEDTEGAVGFPFWSRDSRYIVFEKPGKLLRIEATGGPLLTLCNLPITVLGGFWTSDNKIVVGSGDGGALFEVAAGGGRLTPFTTDHSKDHADAFPSLLPDGRHFVYLRLAPENGGIYAGSLDEKPEHRAGERVLADISAVVFAPSPNPGLGYILFVRGANPANSVGTLMAQPFDTRKLELTGDAVPIAEQVRPMGFSASANGVLVYGIGALTGPQAAAGLGVVGRLTWFDQGGRCSAQSESQGYGERSRCRRITRSSPTSA